MSKIKKVLGCMLISIMLIGSCLVCDVNAASSNDYFQDPDSTFSYDTENYALCVGSRKKVYVYCDYFINDKHISKNTQLGFAEIRGYYLQAKKPALNNKYYDTIVYECKMEPRTIYNGSKPIKGMSQYALFGAGTLAPEERQCSPRAINITYTNTNFSSTTWGGGFAFSVGFDKNKGKTINTTSTVGLAADDKYSHTASNTISYTANSLSLVQSNNDNGYSTWAYDYISHADKILDSYLYSTTFTSGMVEFPVGNSKYGSFTGKVCPCKYEITFGAGYVQDGKIIDRNIGKNRNLGTETGTFCFGF